MVQLRVITLTKKISLPPSTFDAKVSVYIWEKLNRMFSNTCTEKYGYITGITSKIRIIGNYLSSSGNAIFNVEFGLYTFKPSKGDILEGVVCVVFEHGILLDICEKNISNMKVLIPQNNLGDFTWNKSKDSFEGKSIVIVKDCVLRVKLDLVRYENKVYSGIGFVEV